MSLASVSRASVSLPSVSTNRCEIETYFSRKAVRFGDKSKSETYLPQEGWFPPVSRNIGSVFGPIPLHPRQIEVKSHSVCN